MIRGRFLDLMVCISIAACSASANDDAGRTSLASDEGAASGGMDGASGGGGAGPVVIVEGCGSPTCQRTNCGPACCDPPAPGAYCGTPGGPQEDASVTDITIVDAPSRDTAAFEASGGEKDAGSTIDGDATDGAN
jgi:hypothetical protein